MSLDGEQSACAWLIRHGQSTANAGAATSDSAAIPLTALGEQQAAIFAEHIQEHLGAPPTLIVHSPYLRARQTAEATIARFPTVPVEVWPIQEFTYLDPATVAEMDERQRIPLYTRYWERGDPYYRDGGGAESFADFIQRIRDMHHRLSLAPDAARIAVFTHGYIMQATRLLLLFPAMSLEEMMPAIRSLNDRIPIANTEVLELKIAAGRIAPLGQEHIAPATTERPIPHN